MYRDVGIAEQQNVKKQGRGDGIKQFSIRPILHIFLISGKVRGGARETVYEMFKIRATNDLWHDVRTTDI